MARLGRNTHKERISNDSSLSLEGQYSAIQRNTDGHKASVVKKYADAKTYLEKSIEALQVRLKSTLTTDDGMGAEIRTHYKSADQRETLLRESINNGDLKTISAVLSAPGYLSGLSDTQITNLRNQYYETIQPELANELAMLEAALQTVMRALDILPTEFKKAGGS